MRILPRFGRFFLVDTTIRNFLPALLRVQHFSTCPPSHRVLIFRIQGSALVAARRLSDSCRASGENAALPNGRSLFSTQPSSLLKYTRQKKCQDPTLLDGGKKGEVEMLWRDLFSDPAEWRDHRMEKANPKFPDFINKKTGEGLWLDSKWIPPWVESKVATIQPGTLELNNFSWNQRLSRCVKAGQYQKAMKLFQQMQRDGINSNKFTFVPVLNACASLGLLKDGRNIHTQIIQSGFQADVYVGCSLIDMYAKCGSMEEAEKVFNEMPTRNVVSWNAMIHGYVKCGQGQQALKLSGQMQCEGVDPDPVTFVAVLNACASIAALKEGRSFHEQIRQRGYESNVFVGSSLINMYGKCGTIDDAQRVFNEMPMKNVVAWTTMIQTYVRCGQGQKALELSRQMQREGVDPDPVTLMAVLNACASLKALEEGKYAHEQIIRRSYESNVFVGSSLIDMYAKCGIIEEAERVFNEMPTRDLVAWNAMLQGYINCGEGMKALTLSRQMQQEGVDSDAVTFVSILSACASTTSLQEGRHTHELIIQRGYESNVFVGSSLVSMYAKCGSIEDAEIVFNKMSTRDVVAWNAIIQAYVKCGRGQRALELYRQMQLEGVDPDPVTFVAVLNACASIAGLEEGRHTHEQISQRGYESDVFVGNSLIDMYAKCGSMEDAERVFNEMPTRDVVSWTAMIQGYVKGGEGWQALELS